MSPHVRTRTPKEYGICSVCKRVIGMTKRHGVLVQHRASVRVNDPCSGTGSLPEKEWSA